MNHFSGPKSCIAGEDLSRGTRVKVDTANSTSFRLVVVKAGVDETYLGWIDEDAEMSEAAPVVLRGTGGELTLNNSSAMSVGDKIYQAASGRHSTTVNGSALAVAVSACDANVGVKAVLF